MKIFFIILSSIHSLIHLMGFTKAFYPEKMTSLLIPISKPMGIAWLLSGTLMILATILYSLNKNTWMIIALFAVILSQFVINNSWGDAKYGTIANILILLVLLLSYFSYSFENNFIKDVKNNIGRTNLIEDKILTESDIANLPIPVQNYIRYSGFLNKPIVKNMRVVFEGQMRSKDKDWFNFSSVQYNTFDNPTRLFFMKGKMFGLSIPGYHKYLDGKASMNIKLFGLFDVVNIKGETMNQAETVTLFNDMCLLAPGTLIDKRITWQTIDENTVIATFSNDNDISIKAKLIIDSSGKLLNFISEDRTDVSDMQKHTFKTPVNEYKEINGYNLIKQGDAIWVYDNTDFVYGKFNLKDIKYNLKEYEK